VKSDWKSQWNNEAKNPPIFLKKPRDRAGGSFCALSPVPFGFVVEFVAGGAADKPGGVIERASSGNARTSSTGAGGGPVA
jgi:hypothetical protein